MQETGLQLHCGGDRVEDPPKAEVSPQLSTHPIERYLPRSEIIIRSHPRQAHKSPTPACWCGWV